MERRKMAVTEAQKRAYTKYDKENTKLFALKLNKKYESDVIEVLENMESKKAYIVKLIREDVAKKKEQA